MTLTDTIPPTAPDTSCLHELDAFGILSRCHEHVLQKLQVLEGVADELERQRTFDDSRLARLCDVLTMMHTAIPLHSADEEESLFPELRRRQPFAGMQGTPMDCMEHEHVGHRRLLVELERAIFLRDAEAAARTCRAVAVEYREHIGKEEQVLFPLAKEVLADDPAAVALMTQQMRERRAAAGLLRC
jgi:hemerythrin-like domain-containing protein